MKNLIYLYLSILILVSCGEVPKGTQKNDGTKFEYQSINLKKSMPPGTVRGLFSIEQTGAKTRSGVAKIQVSSGVFMETYNIDGKSTSAVNIFKYQSDFTYEWVTSDNNAVGLCKCNIRSCNCEASFGLYKFERVMIFKKSGLQFTSTTTYLNQKTKIRADLSLEAVESGL